MFSSFSPQIMYVFIFLLLYPSKGSMESIMKHETGSIDKAADVYN